MYCSAIFNGKEYETYADVIVTEEKTYDVELNYSLALFNDGDWAEETGGWTSVGYTDTRSGSWSNTGGAVKDNTISCTATVANCSGTSGIVGTVNPVSFEGFSQLVVDWDDRDRPSVMHTTYFICISENVLCGEGDEL